MAKTLPTSRKELVFLIEYRVNPEDAGAIGEVMDKMREHGSADITDVRCDLVGK